MNIIDSFFIIAFSAIFTIVNPVGALGPFIIMSQGDSKAAKKAAAKRASAVAFGVLFLCGLAGSFVFNFFGITLPALKVAGGILLLLISIDMLNARPPRAKGTAEEAQEGLARADVAVFPLAIPLLAGPGAIVSMFILSERARNFWQHLQLHLALFITLLISFLILSQSERIANFMGQIGLNIFSRIMGLILASISVQFMLDGIKAALPGLAS